MNEMQKIQQHVIDSINVLFFSFEIFEVIKSK